MGGMCELMDESYYRKLGFMCGLEIHQRLATREKLFCSCAADMPKSKIIGNVERTQRAVAGELGRIDRATMFESNKRRRFVYNLFEKSACLVDIDEEPPHELNMEALDISLLIALAMHAKIPDEIEPMRKEVVDGSDPSAFQRTMMVGYDGYIKLGERQISIPSIFLEEESSGIRESSSDSVVYDIDRLGVPLIEIDTLPEIRSPEEAKEAALQIGLMLRVTGRVQRGIGSIRQDVNVSIRDGARVEIKGFQDLSTMDKVIEGEVERQIKLIEIKKELVSRNASVGKPVLVTDIFRSTNVGIIRRALSSNGVVYAIKLKGFEGIVGMEVAPGKRLGTEISDYAKMAGVGGIIHGDENLKAYGFTNEEIEGLRRRLGAGSGDSFILIAGSAEMCKMAADAAAFRAEYSIRGVPLETRAVDPKNNTTRFLRPLPGGARMYPETDARPIEISSEHLIEKAKEAEAVNVDKVMAKLLSDIGNKQLAEQMLWSPKLQLYEYIIGKSKARPATVATVLLERMKDLKRLGFDVDDINDDVLVFIFDRYAEGAITRAAIDEILKAAPKTASDVDATIMEKKLGRISGDALLKIVSSFAKDKRNAAEIMAKYRLNVDGEELNDLLKKLK